MSRKSLGMRARRLVSALVALQMALTVFLVGTPALAATQQPTINDVKKGTVTLCHYYKQPDSCDASMDNYYMYRIPSGKVTNIKNSNTKVVEVYEAQFEGSNNRLVFDVKKAGVAKTVSYKYKGKKYKIRVKVVEYTNPLKKLTFGSKNAKNMAKRFNTSARTELKTKVFAGKTIKVKPKTGWSVVSIDCTYSTNSSYKTKTIKNGGTIPKKAYYLRITVKNNETGMIEELDLWNAY